MPATRSAAMLGGAGASAKSNSSAKSGASGAVRGAGVRRGGGRGAGSPCPGAGWRHWTGRGRLRTGGPGVRLLCGRAGRRGGAASGCAGRVRSCRSRPRRQLRRRSVRFVRFVRSSHRVQGVVRRLQAGNEDGQGGNLGRGAGAASAAAARRRAAAPDVGTGFRDGFGFGGLGGQFQAGRGGQRRAVAPQEQARGAGADKGAERARVDRDDFVVKDIVHRRPAGQAQGALAGERAVNGQRAVIRRRNTMSSWAS